MHDADFNMTLQVCGICSVNREEWIITDLAANLLGITTVPLYETLGMTMLQLILQQTEMTSLFGNNKSLLNILSMIREAEQIFLEVLICFEEPSQ